MSLLHKDSSLGVLPELDLFSLPLTQNSLDRSYWLEQKPLSSLSDDAPLEFVIPGSSSEYIDLSETLLYVKAKIIKNDGSDLEKEAVVAPVNNLLHSMFSQIDVYLNGKLITPSSNTYPYRAYIENLLNYGQEAKDTHLSSCMWNNDDATKMEALSDENKGFKKRQGYTAESKAFDLIGKIHSDIFTQERYLISDVDVRVKLVRSKNSFSLMADTNFESKITIMDASLIIRKVKINPSILLAHAKALDIATVKMPINRVDVKVLTIPSGIISKSLDNIYLGQLPKRCIIGFVENGSFNGNYKKNPFNFQNFNLNFLSMTVDGEQVHAKPIQPDFKTQNYIQAYHSLYTGTGIHKMNLGNGITRNGYLHGYFLLAFDLSPDLSASCSNHWNLQKTGSVRIELRFEEALQSTINCIIYSEFQNLIQISKEREIMTDFY